MRTHHYNDDWSWSLISSAGAEVDVKSDAGSVRLEKVPGVRLGQDEVEESRVGACLEETCHLCLGDQQLLTSSRHSQIFHLCADISCFWRSVAREVDCNKSDGGGETQYSVL